MRTLNISPSIDSKIRKTIGFLFLFLLLGSIDFSLIAQTKHQIVPGNISTSIEYGGSVALSGNTSIVGTAHDNDLGPSSGSAYIYNFDSNNWLETQKLTASDGVTQDQFGAAVIIQGNVAIVSSPNDDDLGSNSGSAYIFTFDGTTWIESQKILASDGQTDRQFGLSLDIFGNTLIVGSIQGAYIFGYNGTSWVEEQKLSVSGSPRFGWDVAISGTNVIVGSPFDTLINNPPFATSFGAAYIFSYNGISWIEQQKLWPGDDPFSSGKFGSSVDIDGSTCVIGSDEADMDGGAAYVFAFNGVNWFKQQKLTSANQTFGDAFGKSVGISGSNVIVGAQDDDDAGVSSGTVFLFSNLTGAWVQKIAVTASPWSPWVRFGWAVAISNKKAIIGAPLYTVNGISSGSAFIYDFGPPINDTCNGATTIYPGDIITRNTSYATNGGNPGSCNSLNLGTGPGMWYTFTGLGSNTIVSLCGSSYDTQLGIYTGECGGLICLTSNDDACGLKSEITFFSVLDTTYYIYVTGYQALKGKFILALSDAGTICNNAPVASTSNITSNSVQLNWTAVPDVVSYKIQGGKPGGPFVTILVSAPITSYSVSNLPSNTTYQWWVKAVCNSGGTLQSPPSNISTFTTLTGCPTPTSLNTTNLATNSVTLNWATVPGAVGYKVLGNILGSTPDISLNINSGLTASLHVSNLAGSTTYSWTIQSYCPAGSSLKAERDTFTTLTVAAKSESNVTEDQKIKVYPNPTSGFLHIQFDAPTDQQEIQIYDLSGKLVYREEITNSSGITRIELPAGLLDGLYHLRIMSDDLIYSGKIVIAGPGYTPRIE